MSAYQYTSPSVGSGQAGSGQGTESGWMDRIMNPRVESAAYQDLKFSLHRKLLGRVNLEVVLALPEDRVRGEIRVALARLLDEENALLNVFEQRQLLDEVLDEVFGLGPLEPLLKDPTISDILVNSPTLVYVERKGKLQRTPVEFRDAGHLTRIIEKIVSRVGRRIDESSPMVDARLPDGSRVNAVIPPVALDGPMLCIRRFSRIPLCGEDMVRNLTWTEGMCELLRACVGARLNVIVSGGTGAGKTTILNALSSFIPESERIVTIEDAAELRLQQVHTARLETRPANIEGKGAIHIRELVMNALRMRPDRIIVGEVRGEEALDMMQAMNTGHDGSLTTIHSNSPRDGLSRLEVMMGMASANMSMHSIRQQIISAVDLFVHVARFSDGSRRVTHITECVGMESDTITTQDVFVFERKGVLSNGHVFGAFRATGIRPKFLETLRTAGFALPHALFQTVVEIE
jgi:pilus assembly protein CpaF